MELCIVDRLRLETEIGHRIGSAESEFTRAAETVKREMREAAKQKEEMVMVFVGLGLMGVSAGSQFLAAPLVEKLTNLVQHEAANFVKVTEKKAEQIAEKVPELIDKAFDWAGKKAVEGNVKSVVTRKVGGIPGEDMMEKMCQTVRLFHQELRAQLKDKADDELVALWAAHDASLTNMSFYKEQIESKIKQREAIDRCGIALVKPGIWTKLWLCRDGCRLACVQTYGKCHVGSAFEPFGSVTLRMWIDEDMREQCQNSPHWSSESVTIAPPSDGGCCIL